MIHLYTKYHLNQSNHYWENERKLSLSSVTDGRTDGRTDGEPDGHHHTIIRPVFNGRIKTVSDRMMIFSEMIDLSTWVCITWMSISAITSGRHQNEKNKKIKIFNFNLWNQNLYHIIRSVFKCLKQMTSLEVGDSTSGYFKKKFQILNVQCLKCLKCFTWNYR
jgi:hypothetical protein